MSVLLTENFQGGSNGGAATVSNTAFTHLVEPGWTFVNDPVTGITADTLCGQAVATGAHVIADTPITSTATPFVRFYVKIVSLPGASTVIANLKDTVTGTSRAQLQLSPTGQIRVRNSSPTAIWTSAALATGVWHRIEWAYSNTAATQQLKTFEGGNRHTTTATQDSGAVATTAAGTVAAFQLGEVTADTLSLRFGRVVIDGATSPGSAITNIPPVADAGPNQLNVEPWSTVQLDATASTDPDGFIASYTWTQTGGVTVTLDDPHVANPTYTAPGTLTGDTQTFQVTVTDNAGATNSATVSVAVRLTPEQIMLGGAWKPAKLALIAADQGGPPPPPPAGELTITVSPEPDYKPPRVRIDISDTRPTPAGSLTVTRRAADGHTYPVRTGDGGPLQLSAGQATIFDYEPLYQQFLAFSTDVVGGPTADTSLDVTDVWLVHTGIPSRSQKVKVTSLPPGIRPTARGLHQVLGREDPVPISSGARPSPASTLGLRTFTADQERALNLLCDDDTVLLLNIPLSKEWGWDPCYVSVGDLTPARTRAYGRFPWREWTLPIQVVGRPGGGTQAAITWNEEAATYSSWQAMVDAGVGSWSELAAPTTPAA